jgi:hypothetical protein
MAFDPGGSFVEYKIRVDTSEAVANISELNRLFTTYVSLARRMGLPENIMDAIAKIQQLRITVQMAYRSIMLLETATGPIGWAIGLGGLAITGFMVADATYEVSNR